MREMFQVFNMGHRLEVYCLPGIADQLIALAKGMGIDAAVVGRVEESASPTVVIRHGGEEFTYTK